MPPAARLRRLLVVDDVLCRPDRRHLLLGHQLGGPDRAGDDPDGSAPRCRVLSACSPRVEAPEVRVSAGLDVGYVAAVVRQLLEDAGRDILIEDRASGDV